MMYYDVTKWFTYHDVYDVTLCMITLVMMYYDNMYYYDLSQFI